MSAKSMRRWLWRWIERLRCAVWLHEKEFDASRRALLFGCAAVVAAQALASVPDRAIWTIWPNFGNVDYIELAALTRRTFVPRLHVQIYAAAPLMGSLLRDSA